MRQLVCATCHGIMIHTGKASFMEREYVSSRYSYHDDKSITETAKVKFFNKGLGKWVCLRNRNHKTAMPKPAKKGR